MARTQQRNGKDTTPSYDELAAQIDTIKGDISALTKMMAEYSGAKEKQFEARVKEEMTRAKDAARNAADDARAQAAQFGQQANDFVAEKPGIALGVAAGLGFLVGMLGSRR